LWLVVSIIAARRMARHGRPVARDDGRPAGAGVGGPRVVRADAITHASARGSAARRCRPRRLDCRYRGDRGNTSPSLDRRVPGKTRLTATLIQQRQYVVVLKTNTIPKMTPIGVAFGRSPRRRYGQRTYRRFLLRPRYEHQAREGWNMLERAWKQGGWTVVVDENWYAEKSLGLKRQIEKVLTRTQRLHYRRRWYAASRRYQSFRLVSGNARLSFIGDSRDARTIAEATTDDIRPYITSLQKYQFRLLASKGTRHYLRLCPAARSDHPSAPRRTVEAIEAIA